MGLVVSLILVAVGAILAWAVHSTGGSVDVNTVGYIILAVGLVGLILDLLLWESWGPGLMRRSTAYDGRAEPTYREPAAPRRRTVVEEEDVY